MPLERIDGLDERKYVLPRDPPREATRGEDTRLLPLETPLLTLREDLRGARAPRALWLERTDREDLDFEYERLLEARAFGPFGEAWVTGKQAKQKPAIIVKRADRLNMVDLIMIMALT